MNKQQQPWRSRPLAAALAALLLTACGGGDKGNPTPGNDNGGGNAELPEDPCIPGGRFFARLGEAAPGSGGMVFGNFAAPVIGRLGTAAFTAFIGSDAATADRAAIYYYNGALTLEPVALQGEPLPVAGSPVPLAFLDAPVFSRDGFLTYKAAYDATLPGQTTRPALFLSWQVLLKETSLRLQEGQAVGPGGEVLRRLGGFSEQAAGAAAEERLVVNGRYDPADGLPYSTMWGLWAIDRSGQRTLIALKGEQAPGMPTDTLFSPEGVELRTNDMARGMAGLPQAAAIVDLMNPAEGDVGQALYRWELLSTAAPDLLRSVDVTNSLRGLRMNSAGQVAFIESGPVTLDRILSESGGTLTQVATGDDPAPGLAGATIGSVLALALLEDGRVVFASRLAGGAEDGRVALWYQPAAGSIALALKEGAPLPDLPGVTIDRLDEIHAGWDGRMVARVRLAGSGITTANRTALVLIDGNSVSLLLQTGSAANAQCTLTLLDITVLSDNLPSQAVELIGPGYGGTPRALGHDGHFVFRLAYVEADGTPGEGVAIMKLP